MALVLATNTLDEWLESFDSFEYALNFYTKNFAKAFGLYFDSDRAFLEVAHRNWRAECELWEKTLLMPNSNGLSHLKTVAILLHSLIAQDWVLKLREFDGGDRDGFDFTGNDAEREETRKDINGGGGRFLGFTFVIAVIDWYEAGRTDKVEAFVPRITDDLAHDLMVYLSSGKADAVAIFLILKALYVRTDA